MEKLTGNNLKEYKKKLQINRIQKDVIIGTLLGDASMEIRKGKPVYSIKFEQKLFRTDYINHIYSIFSVWAGTEPKIRTISQGKIVKRSSVWFRTYRHSSFKFYYDIFYSSTASGKKVKVVPKLLHRFLTPTALAYWFMDDGTYHVDKYGNIQYYLNTQSFSSSEQKLLVNALKRNFGIDFNIHKDKGKYRLYLKVLFNNTFVEIIKRYIFPSMTYKLKEHV